MIFVFVEDGTLEVVESVHEARRHYEGVDVESSVYHFFDEDGSFLEPLFTKDNRYGKFLGLFLWSASGEYDLIPNPKATDEPIGLYLAETTHLAPNPWFDSMEEIRTYFLNRGISLEFDTSAKVSKEGGTWKSTGDGNPP